MKDIKADIAVIGAGSGGLSVAAGAAQLGLKVVLFERGEMGGDCLNYGCVPSKALIAAGKAAQTIRTASRFGIADAEPSVDWSAVKAHIAGVIETIAPIDSQERFEGLGVTVVRESARFLDPRTIASESTRVRARRIVIATGARAFAPPIPGLSDTAYLTNETIFSLPDFPRRLVILGGGAIGVELGQAFRRLGAEVTIVEAAHALGPFDEDVRAVALAALKREGVVVREGARAVGVTGTQGAVRVEIETSGGREVVEGSHLLVAVGRKAVTDGLDLERGGVDRNAQGVVVDAWLRSTSNPRVWAVGDVAGREQLTHAAGWHASAFVRSALFRARTRADAAPIPAAVYCEPEIAQIGLSETAARARFGDKVKTVAWSFHENDRAQAERDHEGFARLVVGPGAKILGAQIVGAGAADLVQIVALAMVNKLGLRALTGVVAPYPTRGEIIKRAAGAYYTPFLFSAGTRRLVGLLNKLP
ncbi:MAG: FAD-dependent oxidoreductase [Hyphomonadaceae bacterium]|nr:FAD-dependent oxidoreductase [Hyphomonadaceae bacterium]